ncbi:hypothetical protein Ancab_006507 [Ancistrocladus abbreviatus]
MAVYTEDTSANLAATWKDDSCSSPSQTRASVFSALVCSIIGYQVEDGTIVSSCLVEAAIKKKEILAGPSLSVHRYSYSKGTGANPNGEHSPCTCVNSNCVFLQDQNSAVGKMEKPIIPQFSASSKRYITFAHFWVAGTVALALRYKDLASVVGAQPNSWRVVTQNHTHVWTTVYGNFLPIAHIISKISLSVGWHAFALHLGAPYDDKLLACLIMMHHPWLRCYK